MMSHLLVIVDRLEGKFAVVEFPDRSIKDVPRDQLPADVKEGDCFWYEHDEYLPAPEETEKRKAKISKLTESLSKE